MRNLRAIRYDVCHSTDNATAACWNAAQDEIIVAFGPSEEEPKVRLARLVDQSELKYHDIGSWDALSPNPDMAVDRVVSMHYFGDLTTVCVIMAGGDIVMVREDQNGFQDPVHIEIVGSVDPGIAAARWSPDEEVLALVTTAGTLLLMSRGFETIGETPLTPADLAASKHVSVGWGKKETQFKGRGAAKAMRDPTIPEIIDDGTLSPRDDATAVTISWRGDGEYVAVNAVERIEDGTETDGAPEKHRRVVRVFNREGVLDSASEPLDGLESYLSWRPSGNLMATVQRKASSSNGGDDLNVIFFERNGLRHGQFVLRPPSIGNSAAGPISLDWNPDSTVLAVTYESVVQLWTMGNYHWYLKQEILTESVYPFSVWHPEKSLRLLTSVFGGLASMEYVFSTSRGSLTAPSDHGSVAVVDGKTLKLTPLRVANMPPPMSLFDLPTALPAVDVAFAPNDEAFVAVNALGLEVYSWSWPVNGKRPPRPQLLTSFTFLEDDALGGLIPLQVCFTRDDASTISVLGWGDSLQVASFELNIEAGILSLIGSQDVASGSVLVTSRQNRDLYVQDLSGSFSQLDLQNQASFSFYSALPSLLPWAEVVEIPENGSKIAIGLSRNGHLYANERQLAKNCTSFLVTEDHLVFTTSNHLLKFVHLAEAHDLEIPLDDPETDERCRSIEQGARLVMSVPSNLNVVLQMPRGNLETIFPRAMVVAGIRKLIDSLNYGRAFAFCRSQRVDMNILYDHKPDQFLANVALFLEQLSDVTYINLFLSSLREEDVSKTMYKDTKPLSKPPFQNGYGAFAHPSLAAQQPAAPQASSSSKVNIICDAVLASLAPHKKTNLQNIITAHVSKLPPAIDNGLTVVAQLFKDDLVVAEKAVEHICFLVDVNRLFDHALGLYNLDLAMQVAQQSQRDPKEYVPFIRTLHEMTELRRRYSIDDHLERHEKALAHLAELDVFSELIDYTNKHKLYKAALGIYQYDPARLATVTNEYAKYLESQSKFREAGLAYESLSNYAKATSCYQSAGVSCWRECLFAAQSQTPPLSDKVLEELASTLVDALDEARDYRSVATIQLEYMSSVESAVRSLCKAYEFAEAMRLIVQQRRTDLLETALDSGLGDALSSSTELLADCRSQLKAQVPRILELRQKALEDPLGFYEGERLGGDDIPDDVSIAASSRVSTSASLFTRYSTGTAATGKTGETGGTRTTQQHRNRKKREEKKRARGRKGTVYEQEYLVNSVRRLVERVERARPEIDRLVIGLTRRNMADRARAIASLMSELVESCQAAISHIWQQPQPGSSSLAVPPAEDATNGPAPAESHEDGGRPGGDTAPVIVAFERLSLLG